MHLSTQECKWVSSELSGKPDEMMGRGGRVIGNGQASHGGGGGGGGEKTLGATCQGGGGGGGGGGSNNPCRHMSREVELISRFDCHGLVFFIANIIH